MNTSHRQQQKEKTREALLNTAYEVFSRQGILGTRMSDIAQAAGVSHGTVFLHFDTQEALITQVVEHFCGKIAARTHQLSNACGTLRELLAAHLKVIIEFEPFYARLVIENRLLPQGARDAWVGVQSAISLHFSRAAVLEASCSGKDTTLLFNAWMGMIYYYILNGDLYAPEDGVIGQYGERLVDFFMSMATGKTGSRAQDFAIAKRTDREYHTYSKALGGTVMRVLKPGTFGSDVMEIQALLKKMGLDPGPVDGRFGQRTQSVVAVFQQRFGLVPDGIVGANTWRALDSFLNGYDIYFVQPGDTLYAIARKYGAWLPMLLAANPEVDPQRLTVGQRIVVPYNFDMVDTNIGYTYAVLQRDVQGLKVRYPFIETGAIGQSVLGKNLYYLRLGTGPKTVMYNAAHHALEWITSPVLMKFAEDYAKAYALGQALKGFRPADMWDDISIYIVPMVNPDGVDLVIDGLQPGNPYGDNLIRWNSGSADFSQDWEANIRGVDLNHNYDAAWEQSKQAEAEMGITGPGPTRYSGPYAESEPESRAMADFTRNKDPRLVMAYHSQGQVIFWDFENLAPPEAKTIGKRLAALSGYALASPEGIASYAGYKDWFIQDYRRPGYTIEVGKGKNPLPISQFTTVYADNLPMLLYAAMA